MGESGKERGREERERVGRGGKENGRGGIEGKEGEEKEGKGREGKKVETPLHRFPRTSLTRFQTAQT